MKLKSLLSVLLCGAIVAGTVQAVYAANSNTDIKIVEADSLEQIYPGEDDGTVPTEPTWYIWQDTTSESSFDVNKTAAAESSTVSTKEVMYVGIYNDKSTILPASTNREITPVTGGKLTLEVGFALDREMDGTAFRLLDGSKTAFGIVTKNSGVYLEQPNGKLIYLSSYSTSRIIDSFVTDVKAVVDIDKNIIESVYINGELCAENKPFAENIRRITSFDMTTSREAVGNVMMRYIKLYGGYDVYEMFHSGNGLPCDWVKTGNGAAGLRVFNYRYADRNSLELDSTQGSIQYKKKTASHTGKVTFETQLLLPQKRNGVKVSLMNNDTEGFSFVADTSSFSYKSGDKNASFYNYLGNLWYHFKVDVDLTSHTADIYLNGKLQKENAAISNVSEINGIAFSVDQGGGTVVADDIILYDTPELPSDYVPEPEKVSSDDYAIAMQMCPLWTEGSHNGWDEMNAAKGRVPVLGYYDEGDPEYTDWAIKYMAEHGIDFWLPCMYTCYALEEAERDPIKDNSFRHGYAIHNGYFNAQYSDEMPFAILWENGGYTGARATEKDFFENLVPFWIEYYFKDPRYYKLDGRPVFTIYNPDNFFTLFDTNLSNENAIISGVNKFKQMCIDSGVGEPLIMTNTSKMALTQDILDKWSRLGIEGLSKYNYSTGGNLENVKNYLNEYKTFTASNGMEVFPALCTGFNGVPWDSSSVGFEATPEEYKEFLQWTKDEYLPSLPKSDFSKRILLAATWDEFGEGTIICPTEKYGFGHLDAIRDVFVGDSEHKDIVPTTEQKARISNLYNPDRNANYTKEIVLPDVSTQETLYSWDFSNDLGDWSLGGGISNVEHRNGAAVMTINSLKPALTFAKPIDLYNVNYIKVTMKSGPSKGGYFTWTTNLKPNASEKWQYRVMPGVGTPNGEYTDYYIPIAENIRYWKGELATLTFTLGQFYDTSVPVEIKSIEFLGTPEKDLGVKLNMGSYNVALDTVTDTNGNVYANVEHVVNELGGKFGLLVSEDSAIIKMGSNSMIIKTGSKVVEKNGVAGEIAMAPVMHNGAMYVPVSVLGDVTFSGFSYDSKSKTLECTSVEAEETGERAVLYEYRFETNDDIAGMSFNSGFSKRSFTDGGLKLTVGSDDPYFYIKPENINASNVKRIEIGLKSSIASTGKIYFATENATNLNEAKTLGFPLLASEETKAYTLNCEANSQWSGNLIQLRMDLVDKGCTGEWINIEYLRFLGDVIVTAEGNATETCVDVSDTAYVWNFNKNTVYDGFAPSKHIADLNVINGELCFRASDVTPMIETGRGVNIDADKFKTATIQLKNNTAGNYMRMYFTKDDGGAIEKQNCYEVVLTPNDATGTMYTIDLSSNVNWNGEVKGLLLEFSGEQGLIKIDNIRFEIAD